MKSAILIATLLAPTALSGAVPDVVPRRLTTRLEDRTTGYQGEQNLESDALARAAGKIQLKYQKEEKKDQWKKCNPSNIVTRREWSTFKDSEKLDYTRAVKCLSKLPSKTPKSECPGCKSRYDDFVATHIKQAFTIHLTGNFLAWHRWYVHAHEQALRDECNYKGHQPYYNWPRWASDPMKSPLLDNSPTSISGNGQPSCPNQTFFGIPDNINPLFKIPAGNGGGCVTGPFKDWPINIGPGVTGSRCTPPNPISNFSDPNFGLAYNPRCLKRDISAWAASTGSSDVDVVKLLHSPDIATFWADMQGGLPSFANGYMGVHTAGHYTIGGDPGSDFMASPYDPYFFFHHAQVDRVWWAWQNADPKSRTDALYGPIVLGDFSTPNATLADEMTIGYAAPYKMKIGEAMSTMAGVFCYRYE